MKLITLIVVGIAASAVAYLAAILIGWVLVSIINKILTF